MKDQIRVKGNLNIVVRDKNGNIKHDITTNNLVVNSGFSFIASRMIGTASSVMSHMAIGSDNTAATLSQTALGTETQRVVLASSTQTESSITYVAEFPPSTLMNIYEAGIVNDATAGDMLCRTTFPLIVKTEEDTITINWTISIVG